jgi:PAS domain S-box-containing protein
MCRQLLYSREELMEMGPTDILTEESIKTWLSRFSAMKKGEYIDDTVEYQAIRKDGSLMWVLITADYIENDEKNVIGANVVAIDITERKEAEIALKRKEVEVYETLEHKIQQWRREIDERSAVHQNAIENSDLKIQTIFEKDDFEVS